MHEHSKAVSMKNGVSEAGQKVAGLGKLAWRRTLREDFLFGHGRASASF